MNLKYLHEPVKTATSSSRSVSSGLSSSASGSTGGRPYYTRHFFIPPYWRTAEESIIEVVPDRNTVTLAYGDDLIVFSTFLDSGEKVYLDDNEDLHNQGIGDVADRGQGRRVEGTR
jgi:hypothetical protein